MGEISLNDPVSVKGKGRKTGLFTILFIYCGAVLFGLWIYLSFLSELLFPYSLLIADVAATLFVFLFSLIFRNASVYDPYWSVQPPVILLAFAFSSSLTPLTVLLLVSVFFWGIRLTVNWTRTFQSLEKQDWRYDLLKEKSGPLYFFVNLFGIHLVPTLVVFLCILPPVTAVRNGAVLNPLSALFGFLSFGAVILEWTADRQMRRFRETRSGSLIRTGLWRYSRHPNYLGEILYWWCMALTAVSAIPGDWTALAGAAVNTALFLTVSIPMADRRQSGKPGFDQYRSETRMLLPLRKPLFRLHSENKENTPGEETDTAP